MSLIKVPINAADPASIDSALRTEWLLTNGVGGYAMGTLLGANTRRYHGLLIAATRPPIGRVLTLHSMSEQLILRREGEGKDGASEEAIDLSTQQFDARDTRDPILHPSGWRYLTCVRLATPRQIVWTYQIGAITVHRHLQIHRGENAITLQYQFMGVPSGAAFRVRPLLALRDFHGLNTETREMAPAVHASPYRTWSVNDVRLRMRDAATWRDEPQWWHDFHYQRERERGQDSREHVYSPGYVIVDSPGRYEPPLPPLELRFGDGADFPALSESRGSPRRSPRHPALADAAGQFIVRRHAPGRWFSSILAGYPWFGDWGRDTMISLPGLILCTGRFNEAQSILSGYARHLRNGLIPNLFDDYGGAAHYNTVDASLWFVHAVHEAWRWRMPEVTINDPRVFDACHEIIAAYRRGTDFGIRMDDDGLIIAGDESTQLTWMDAKRDGVVFTPRCGKAVEINTLWHNALMCLSRMTGDAGQRNDLLTLARRVAASFRAAFWWNEQQCLHDCLMPGRAGLGPAAWAPPAVNEAGSAPPMAGPSPALQRFEPDGRLRPNQILAVSLPFSPLNDAQQHSVVDIVGERLLTPYGLRTLDRDDPGYRGRYEGDLFQRDAAYHNGTVWPWLIGSYCEALLRVKKFSDDAKRRVREIIQPLIDEMSNTSGGRCLGQIAEVYDGDAPHRPSGCPAQAWTVAEVLRILTLVE
jgi:glycogen debranching enzyme